MNYIDDVSERVDLVRMIVDQNYGLVGEKMRAKVLQECKGSKQVDEVREPNSLVAMT
jgi:hypothetical protein